LKKFIQLLIVILFLAFTSSLKAQDSYPVDTIQIILVDSAQNMPETIKKEWPQYISIGKHQVKNPVYVLAEDVAGKNKATVIVLTLLTGPLGGHRLYLGTKPIVPIVYTLTLGGGVGVLPFIDLVVICFSKDISRFENNDKIFMWAK
jgi:hypothetical protein